MMQPSLIHYLSLIILVVLVFSPSLRNDFVFDDHEALVKNRDLLLDELFSSQLFLHDFWGKDMVADSSHKSYRPLTILVYRLIRILGRQTGKLDPLHFHIANLVSYLLVCCYLYKTLKVLLDPAILNSKLGTNDCPATVAFQIAILFAVHPVHCEPISSCVGLADILSALFWLISVNIYLKNIDIIFKSKWNLTKLLAVCLPTILSVTVSMFLKEQGITSLGFLIFLNLYFMLQPSSEKAAIRCFKMVFGATSLFLVAVFALLYFRMWIMYFNRPIFGPMDNPSSHVKNPFFRSINYGFVHILNVLITVCPIWLSFDWSMGCIRLIESFRDIRLIFVFLFWTGLLIFTGFLLTRPKLRHLVIFLTFSLVTFLPSSNLFFPVGFVIAERNLFLPILGYIAIFVICHGRLLNAMARQRRILNWGMYLVMAMFALKSFQRSFDWNDELDLFEKDVSVCPSNAKIYYNIAKVSADRGNKTKAVEHYRKALYLYENYTNALNNLANILKEEGQLPEARSLLEKACHLDPKFATAWMNLATIEISLGNFEKAELYLRNSIVLRPDHVLTHFNMGNLHLKQKKFIQAEIDFTKTINLDPSFCKAWHNLILLKQNLNETDQAYRLSSEALSSHHCPTDDSLHFLMANILGQLEHYSQAEKHFQEAIRLNPNNAVYLNNLAVLYHRQQKYPLAIEYYKETLRLNPQHRNARNNLQQIENGIFLKTQGKG